MVWKVNKMKTNHKMSLKKHKEIKTQYIIGIGCAEEVFST